MARIANQACPMCGSREAQILNERTFQGQAWSLARCPDCGLHFTDPLPSDEEIRRFYEGDYHSGLYKGGIAEAVYGAKYERYAEILRRHVPSGRIVDVGCTTGLFVRMLCDRGYDAEGVELNPHSAAWGRSHYGVTIYTEPLERCSYEPGSLQALTLTDVLEHTSNPCEFLGMIRGLLAPRGVVLVTFPDIRSLESRYYYRVSRLLRRDWLWSNCHIPKHTWEFTRPTAEACFVSAGFRVVEFRRSQPVAVLPDGSFIMSLFKLPSRVLSWAPLDRWMGTQMEFVIEKSVERFANA